MFRSIPTSNKICATKETFQNQQILYSHVQSMRPQIDNKPPKQYEFLKNQKIKEALKNQKQQEIDRENRNLISKITNIMAPNNGNSVMGVKRSQSSNLCLQKKSLNKNHRKKELIKIVMENQQLLKRIEEQKSQYNVKNWGEERKWVEKYISNISEYPYKDFKPTKTLVQFWNNSRISESSMQKREQGKRLEPIQVQSQQQKVRRSEENKESLMETQKSVFDYQPFEPQSIYYMKDDPLFKTSATQQDMRDPQPEPIMTKVEAGQGGGARTEKVQEQSQSQQQGKSNNQPSEPEQQQAQQEKNEAANDPTGGERAEGDGDQVSGKMEGQKREEEKQGRGQAILEQDQKPLQQQQQQQQQPVNEQGQKAADEQEDENEKERQKIQPQGPEDQEQQKFDESKGIQTEQQD